MVSEAGWRCILLAGAWMVHNLLTEKIGLDDVGHFSSGGG